MELKITGTPDEIEKLLNAIGGSKEQYVQDINGHLINASTYLSERNNRKQDPLLGQGQLADYEPVPWRQLKQHCSLTDHQLIQQPFLVSLCP